MLQSRLVEKLVHAVPHQFGVGKSENLGDALIHGADFAFQRRRENQMVETVDQVAVTLPGSGDDFGKPFELFGAGRGILDLLESPDKPAQFVDFVFLVPNVGPKQDDENPCPDGKRLEMPLAGLQRLVGQDGNTNRKNDQHQNRQAPDLSSPCVRDGPVPAAVDLVPDCQLPLVVSSLGLIRRYGRKS